MSAIAACSGGAPSSDDHAGRAGVGGSGLPTASGGMGGSMAGTDGASTDAGAGGNAGAGEVSGRGGTAAPGPGGQVGGAAGNGTSAGGTAGGAPIIDLFNGTDLRGWTAYREPATTLTTSEALQIFKPEDGAIRVYGDAANGSTQSRHTLVSTASYSTYTLRLEYRWGTKVYAPYTDLTRYPRDAGILFHLHGDTTKVWPSSIEFQIKDGTTGDIFALYARCTSLAKNNGTTFVDAADGGTPKVVDGANGNVQHSRSANYEIDGWNSVELQVSGGAAVYVVNGHVVNKIVGVNDRSGTTGVPITAGPIALQAEHAEVFYRNIRIEVVK
jgi:hypothetical protein